MMKKNLIFLGILTSLFFGSCAKTSNSSWQDDEKYETSKLNNRQLEKNINKYASQLELTSRQKKQLDKIEKRYSKKEKRLVSKGGKRTAVRELQEVKREAMLDVLTTNQLQKLEKLTGRKRLFRFSREKS